VIEAVCDLLLAPRCAGCDAPGRWFCVACRDACDAVSLGQRIRGAGAFGGPLREAVHRLKYAGERALAADLGAMVAALLARDLAHGARCDLVVPIPLHADRAAERGYDQAALLAAFVAAATGLPLRPALHRIRAGAPQVTLDRRERAVSVRGAFVAVAGSLRGCAVALVDDVATTGATFAAAAAAARAAGAREVRGYVVAVDE
jgi:ComF family protein